MIRANPQGSVGQKPAMIAKELHRGFQVAGGLCHFQLRLNGQWEQFQLDRILGESLDLMEEQPLEDVVSMKLMLDGDLYTVPGK